MRIPSSTGIAGWVLVTGQPIVIDDLQQDPRFARQAAERTGYVPTGPDGRAARERRDDRSASSRCSTAPRTERSRSGEIDLLILFANQAAIGLDLLQTARRARAVAEQGEGGRGRGRPARGAARAHGGRVPRHCGCSRRSRRCSQRLPTQVVDEQAPERRRGARRRLFRAHRRAKELGLDVREVSLRRRASPGPSSRWPSKSGARRPRSLLFTSVMSTSTLSRQLRARPAEP